MSFRLLAFALFAMIAPLLSMPGAFAQTPPPTEARKPPIRTLAEFKRLTRDEKNLAWGSPEEFGLAHENTYIVADLKGEDVKALFARKNAKLLVDTRLEVDSEELYFNDDSPRAFIGGPRAFYAETFRSAATGELIGLILGYLQDGCEGEAGAFEEMRYATSALAAAAGCFETDVQWQWHATYYGDGRVVSEDERMEWSGY